MSASGRIGLVVGVKGGKLVVVGAADGTPGHRAGLRPGDHIIRIDQDDTANMDRKAAAARLTGAPGTQVVLSVARAGVDEPVRFVVVREVAAATPLPAGTGKFFLGLLGVLIVAGAVAAFAWSSTSPHREGATKYARLVREKRPREAYELLANERRRAVSYEAWLGTMSTPLLARATGLTVSSTSSNSTGRGCVNASVEADGETVGLTFFTLAEGEGVRIHSVMTNEEQSGVISPSPWLCK